MRAKGHYPAAIVDIRQNLDAQMLPGQTDTLIYEIWCNTAPGYSSSTLRFLIYPIRQCQLEMVE